MGAKYIFTYMLVSILVFKAYPQVSELPLASLANSPSVKLSAGKLEFSPVSGKDGLTCTFTPEQWRSNPQYLVCKIKHHNAYSAILYFDFYSKTKDRGEIVQQGGESAEEARISAKIGVLPGLETQVIFPLSYLDGQHIFMTRFPRQLKGTVLGRRIELQDIAKVVLRVGPYMEPSFKPQVTISQVYLTGQLPAPLKTPENPVVDAFGQWTLHDWMGKTHSEEELRESFRKQEKTAQSAYPSEWSRYGGYKNICFDSTGFFHTKFDGKRWWLVDPAGYAYLSNGFDCIRQGSQAAMPGFSDLYKWLPDQNDSLYKSCFGTAKGWDSKEIRTFDFVKANFIRVYGINWRTKWVELTSGFMKENLVNSIGNWSDSAFCSQSGIPYVLPLKNFPTTDKKLFRDFPDVFDTTFRQKAKVYAAQLNQYKNDPLLIGYFLDNEPHWAFGDHNIAFEMFATAKQSFTKKRFVEWLKQRYDNSLDGLSTDWNMEIKSFEQVKYLVFKNRSDLNEEAWKDLKEFSGVMVDELVKTVCEEVKKVDSNHLNLGLRYAWLSSDLCYRAGAYFDVFSINGYSSPGPPETAEITKRSGKPVLIGEFHFGATDRGLPANGIQGAPDQDGRATAYRYYVEQGFARPEIVGMHYFQWYDQPVLGRYDGENYNIGLFDITGKPYPEFQQAAKTTHRRMYQVAAGELKPFDVKIPKTPQIFY